MEWLLNLSITTGTESSNQEKRISSKNLSHDTVMPKKRQQKMKTAKETTVTIEMYSLVNLFN